MDKRDEIKKPAYHFCRFDLRVCDANYLHDNPIISLTNVPNLQ